MLLGRPRTNPRKRYGVSWSSMTSTPKSAKAYKNYGKGWQRMVTNALLVVIVVIACVALRIILDQKETINDLRSEAEVLKSVCEQYKINSESLIQSYRTLRSAL